MTKVLSQAEAAKVMVETTKILGEVISTSNALHEALMRFRERKVRFIVGAAESMDSECDQTFGEACEILRLMAESIPTRIASALLSVECDAPQNAPGVNTIH